MAKNNQDYDNIFKTLKYNHQRFFISIVNKFFNKHYRDDANTLLLPTGGINNMSSESEEKESDFLMCIEGDTYLLECQSYPDGSMAMRMAEYTFNAAKNNAINENGRITLNMPAYNIIYIKSDNKTPKKTEISFVFPNNETIKYDCNNIILSELTKETIIEDKLFAFIPFYITRYEKIISKQDGDLSPVLADLHFFREELERLYSLSEIKSGELLDIMSYVNRIIRHITDGNCNEERLVHIMGGEIEETPSHQLQRLNNEKVALNLFESGVSFEIVRNAISIDILSDDRLNELYNLALHPTEIN